MSMMGMEETFEHATKELKGAFKNFFVSVQSKMDRTTQMIFAVLRADLEEIAEVDNCGDVYILVPEILIVGDDVAPTYNLSIRPAWFLTKFNAEKHEFSKPSTMLLPTIEIWRRVLWKIERLHKKSNINVILGIPSVEHQIAIQGLDGYPFSTEPLN